MAGQESNRWHSSCFACFADCGICCKTCCCPCLTYQDIRDAMHGGSSPDGSMPALLYALVCVIFGFQFIFGFMNRMDMRKKYGLETQCCCCKGEFAECCLHFCCHTCAMCQEARELQNRPLTPWSLGVAGPVIPATNVTYTTPIQQPPIPYGAPVPQATYPPSQGVPLPVQPKMV